MKNLLIALFYLLLFIPSCTGVFQSRGNLGVLPQDNRLGPAIVLAAEMQVTEVNIFRNGSNQTPNSIISLQFQDPSIQNCLGVQSYHRFISIESDDDHLLPWGTIIEIQIPALGYIKTIECHYDCSKPKYIWEELPKDFSPNMEIKLKIEGEDLTNASLKGGGLLVIVNADIIINPGDDVSNLLPNGPSD